MLRFRSSILLVMCEIAFSRNLMRCYIQTWIVTCCLPGTILPNHGMCSMPCDLLETLAKFGGFLQADVVHAALVGQSGV